MLKFIIIDYSDYKKDENVLHVTYDYLFESNVEVKFINLKSHSFNVTFDNYILIITSLRKLENKFINQNPPNKIIFIQHGLQTTPKNKNYKILLKKFSFSLLKRFLFKTRVDYFVYFIEKLHYAISIIDSIKYQMELKEESINVDFNPESKNVLFIGQPNINHYIGNYSYDKSLRKLHNYIKKNKLNLFYKPHPRELNKETKYLEYNAAIKEYRFIIGWSSSILIELYKTIPAFSLLDKKYLPNHLHHLIEVDFNTNLMERIHDQREYMKKHFSGIKLNEILKEILIDLKK